MATTIITSVHPDDVRYELQLAKKFTDQVGFLTAAAVSHYAAIGSVWRATENDQDAGFLVAQISKCDNPRMAQIYQAAVQLDAQRREHGLALVQHACDVATSRGAHAVQCWCAADLEANAFWAAAGFEARGRRIGGKRRGRDHILWQKGLLLRLDQFSHPETQQEARRSVRMPLDDLWDRPILDLLEGQSQEQGHPPSPLASMPAR